MLFNLVSWSHNKADSHFATQQTVFDDIGQGCLENAWQGYNVSLFAYGQTGSGKSYSMVGYGEDLGIVPLMCREIFEQIKKKKEEGDGSVQYKVEATMIEIYNEQVREDPTTGPYVKGLEPSTVKSYAEISKLMEEGNNCRTVAATQMNKTSSRAHTLFQIIFTQITTNTKTQKVMNKVSKINLVDLAGSEKISQTGATGDTMKQGININKSLSALGNCISALADKCSGKNKNAFIPYRDSKLTYIMKESLGGNSKTVMIAAVSPASVNYSESLSTLRYANRAKQIKTQAVVNEDPNEKAIKELKNQVAELEKQLKLAKQGIDPSAASSVSNEESEKLRRELEESQAIIKRLQMTNEEKEEITKQMSEARHSVLQDAGILSNQEAGFDRTKQPHLVNLNEDPLMSDSLLYPLNSPGTTTLGKRAPQGDSSTTEKPDIALGGLGVAAKHCTFEVEPPATNIIPKIFIVPGDGQTFVNGKLVKEKTPLLQGFRIIVGNNHIFRFNHPAEAAHIKKEKQPNGDSINNVMVADWSFAQKELAEAQGLGISLEKSKVEQELQEKLEKIEKEKKEQQDSLEKQRLEMEKNQREFAERAAQQELLLKQQLENNKANDSKAMQDLQDQLKKQQQEAQLEIENQKKILEAKQLELQKQLEQQRFEFEGQIQQQRKKREERSILEERISKLIPMINEANAISKEFKKQMEFSLKLFRDNKENMVDNNNNQSLDSKLGIHVKDIASDTSIIWSEDQFIDRIYLMREVYEQYLTCLDSNQPFKMPDSDPFVDQEAINQHVLIGTSRIFLKSLAHNIDFETYTTILDYKGKSEGELKVSICPCDDKGRIADDDDDDDIEIPMYNDPSSELPGQPMHFYIKIIHARGLNTKVCRDVYARYKFFLDDKYTETKQYMGESMNPEIDFCKRYDIPCATKDLVQYLQQSMLIVEVLAKRHLKQGAADKLYSAPATTNVQELQDRIVALEKEKEEAIRQRDQVVQDLNFASDQKGMLNKENNQLSMQIKQLETLVEQKSTTSSEAPKQSNAVNLESSNLEMSKKILELESRLKSVNSNDKISVEEHQKQVDSLKKQIEEKNAQIENSKNNNNQPNNTPTTNNHNQELIELKERLTKQTNEMESLKRKDEEELRALRIKLKEYDEKIKNMEQQPKSKACLLM
ncbi:kinesin-like protein [Acrasis kona]|uniref:Kinesin-like protein n=1 Tax=Acrasis kona TaxID=1008807 RepID=A0AAW2Z832_9EUKA